MGGFDFADIQADEPASPDIQADEAALKKELEAYSRRFYKDLHAGNDPVYDPPLHPCCGSPDDGPMFTIRCQTCNIQSRTYVPWATYPDMLQCPFCDTVYGDENVAKARSNHLEREE